MRETSRVSGSVLHSQSSKLLCYIKLTNLKISGNVGALTLSHRQKNTDVHSLKEMTFAKNTHVRTWGCGSCLRPCGTESAARSTIQSHPNEKVIVNTSLVQFKLELCRYWLFPTDTISIQYFAKYRRY